MLYKALHLLSIHRPKACLDEALFAAPVLPLRPSITSNGRRTRCQYVEWQRVDANYLGELIKHPLPLLRRHLVNSVHDY